MAKTKNLRLKLTTLFYHYEKNLNTMAQKFLLALILLLAVLAGCKDTNSSETDTNSNDTNISNDSLAPVVDNTVTVYAWVDKLRMRTAPDTKSDVVAEIPEGGAMTYLEEKTDFTQQITLRGKSYDEPWLKVKTKEGKIGWVYGGGVKFYQPKVGALPSPYDRCMDYLKRRRVSQANKCIADIEGRQLTKDRQYVNKPKEGALEFTLLNGKKKLFDDSEIEEAAAQQSYFYRYYVPQMGLFVIAVDGQETDAYRLINDKSGKETNIWGFPRIAPDFKKLISYRGDLKNDLERNGLQIFGYTDQGLELIWEKKLDRYEPIIVKWLDIEEAEVTLLPKSSGGNLRLKVAKLMKNDAGEWVLDI